MTETSASTSPAPFGSWAIVELMGRRRLAGFVTADAPLLQATRLQVDIYPGDVALPAATCHTSYPVYCLTPCTEALARKIGTEAVRYEMPVPQWGEHPAIDGALDVVTHAYDCDLGSACDGECNDGTGS